MPKERVKVERRRKRKIEYKKILRDFQIPEEYLQKIIRDLKNGASPQSIAIKYGVMVSTVRSLAEDLVKKGELTYVVKNSRFVYYIAPEKLRS